MAQSSLGPISSCQWELSWLPNFLKMESSAVGSQPEVASGQHLCVFFSNKGRTVCVLGAAALTHIPETGRLGRLFRERRLRLHLCPQPTPDLRLPSAHRLGSTVPGIQGQASGAPAQVRCRTGGSLLRRHTGKQMAPFWRKSEERRAKWLMRRGEGHTELTGS